MAYGQKSLAVFGVIVGVLVLLIGGGLLFFRFALPNILTDIVLNPESDMMEAEDKAAIKEGLDTLVEVLGRYGLSRQDAIEEFAAVQSKDFNTMLQSFTENPPPTPGEAAVFVVEQLGIEGINSTQLAEDVALEVSQDEYENFLSSEEFENMNEVNPAFAKGMFPVLKQTFLEILESDYYDM